MHAHACVINTIKHDGCSISDLILNNQQNANEEPLFGNIVDSPVAAPSLPVDTPTANADNTQEKDTSNQAVFAATQKAQDKITTPVKAKQQIGTNF